MQYLLFSGSLRTESLNKKLITVVQKILNEKNSETDIVVADLKSLSVPVYDGDIEAAGIPAGVKTLGEKIQQAQALIISSPEYNGSIAGSLKNTIDWVSRLKPMPLESKPILLLGASPGNFGSIRALGITRAPLETLGSYVFPRTFALPKANEAFSNDGSLLDPKTLKNLDDLLSKFELFAKRLS